MTDIQNCAIQEITNATDEQVAEAMRLWKPGQTAKQQGKQVSQIIREENEINYLQEE